MFSGPVVAQSVQRVSRMGFFAIDVKRQLLDGVVPEAWGLWVVVRVAWVEVIDAPLTLDLCIEMEVYFSCKDPRHT